VLGLISSKRAQLESADEVVARIEEAARFLPVERMALSTQCGFGTVWEGNPITPAVQEAKLRLVAQVARRVWI
jgi:5-methyltetrahydropteroyltriglutamate--homocysteine methyltransferase